MSAHKKLRPARITCEIKLAVLVRPLIQLFPAQNVWKIRQLNPLPTLTLVSMAPQLTQHLAMNSLSATRRLNYGREKHDRTQMQVFGWNSLRWPAHNNTNGNHQVGDPGKVLFETFIIAATPHSMGNLIVIGRMNGLTN